jgi:hypothetical protein
MFTLYALWGVGWEAVRKVLCVGECGLCDVNHDVARLLTAKNG